MPIGGISKIDYSNRDFTTIKESLITYIKTRFPVDYKDFSEGKLGMMYLELCAWVGDMLSYMIDISANESYITTCKQLSSAFKLSSLIGYTPRQPSAASVTMKVSTVPPTGFPLDCSIPKGTQIQVNSLFFELLEDYIIPSGTSEVTGPTFVEGKSYQDEFTANGQPFQSYALSEVSVINNSIEVYVNDVLWDRYESLVFIGDNNGYSVTLTPEYGIIIRFGDGVSGRIPSNLDNIKVLYRTGGGSSGNIAALSIVNKSIPAVLSDLTSVQVYLTNENPGSGGEDAETLEQIKLNAPLYYRSHRNVITQEDYNTLISTFSDPTYGSIAKGIAVPRYGRTNSSANEVDVYVLARGPLNVYVPCSQGLKQALLDYLNERAVIVVDVFINDGLIREIDIHVSAIVDLGYNNASAMRLAIIDKIREFFTRPDINLGGTFFISQLYEYLHEVPGLIQSNLGIPGSYKFPSVDEIVLSSSVVGLSTIVYLTTGGLTPNAYEGGEVLFTSGAHNTQRYRIIRNTADTITIGKIASNILSPDTLTIYSELNSIEDTPVEQNEIYQLGNLTVDLYYYSKDTREVALIHD